MQDLSPLMHFHPRQSSYQFFYSLDMASLSSPRLAVISGIALLITAFITATASMNRPPIGVPTAKLNAAVGGQPVPGPRSLQERVPESPNPPKRPIAPRTFAGSVGSLSLTWTTCGSCPEIAEVNVSGDTVSMGVANRSVAQPQNIAIHGAAAALPPSNKYTISFDYDWYTFDSYSPPSEGYNGFWDSFSVSVASEPYWQLALANPITTSNISGLGFIWGGQTYGSVLHHVSGSNRTITVPGNASGNNYLNVVLDTRTPPADRRYPSWGSVTIKSIRSGSDCEAIASQAANLATTVTGGAYSYGGKGFTCQTPRRFVASNEILTTYVQSHHVPCGLYDNAPIKCESAPGVDCSGLIFWSYNKTVGATTYSNGFVKAEGSSGQCGAGASDPVGENDIRPGDIACFSHHVAMYVGNGYSGGDAVEAANCSSGIRWTTKTNLKGREGFQGFRRLQCSSQYALSVKSHSPISLVVTDPDGYSISVDTTLFTDEEVLHEIPGILYYVRDDIDGDVVLAPTLKPGVYQIHVVPKQGAAPDDTFGLEVTGEGYFLELATDVPINSIPPEGYSIRSTGDEITPVNPNLIPLTISCPASINTAASASCPITPSKAVNYPAPQVSGNSPTTVVCNPPTGSAFPVGTTTVTCTASDASNNTAQCMFTVTVHSFCLQDETNNSNVVFVNANTGEYNFFCNGVQIASGTGTLTAKACVGTIEHVKGDRRVLVQWDTTAQGGKGAGTAIVQASPNNTRCQIIDKDMSNNNCAAPTGALAPNGKVGKGQTQK